MIPYPSILTIYKRDPRMNHRTLLEGEYAHPAFRYLSDAQWVFTEKVDGMNIRVESDPEIGVVLGGRTENAQIPAALISRLSQMFSASDLAEVFPDGGCLYGEGYGARIQKGGGNYQPDGVDFVLFDVLVGDYWLERPNILDVANRLNISTVPFIGSGTLGAAIDFTREGFSSRWGDFPAEGIVARPDVDLFDRRGHRILAKIKTRDFQ